MGATLGSGYIEQWLTETLGAGDDRIARMRQAAAAAAGVTADEPLSPGAPPVRAAHGRGAPCSGARIDDWRSGRWSVSAA